MLKYYSLGFGRGNKQWAKFWHASSHLLCIFCHPVLQMNLAWVHYILTRMPMAHVLPQFPESCCLLPHLPLPLFSTMMLTVWVKQRQCLLFWEPYYYNLSSLWKETIHQDAVVLLPLRIWGCKSPQQCLLDQRSHRRWSFLSGQDQCALCRLWVKLVRVLASSFEQSSFGGETNCSICWTSTSSRWVTNLSPTLQTYCN